MINQSLCNQLATYKVRYLLLSRVGSVLTKLHVLKYKLVRYVLINVMR